MSNFFSFGGPKGKKLPLGDQEKKSSSRGLKKKVIISFGLPKEKKIAHGGGRTRIFFFSNFGNFFQHVKKLLNF